MTRAIKQQTFRGAAGERVARFREARGPFVEAIETTRMAMIFTDGRGEGNRLVYVNDSFVALTGFAREAVIGLDLSFLLVAASDSECLSSIDNALASGMDGNWELQCRRADGTEFLAVVYLSPVRDESGVVQQNFLSFVELDGQTDRMLNRQNGSYAIYEQAPGFIAVTTGPDHVFTFANESYKRLVGRDDLVGMTVAEALPDIAGQGFMGHVDRVFTTGEPFVGKSMPIRLQPPDSTSNLHYISFVYQPVRDTSSTITGLFCEGYDVTAEREAADKLAIMQSELIHLARVNAMGAMATTLAHELNQPLAAISSYVAGCNRLLDPDASNAAQIGQALQAAEEASQRAGDIIRHVRDLTLRGGPAKASFGLRVAIDECVRLVRAGGCGDVEMRDHTDGDVTMVGDRVQIQQVIINLLRNACDAVAAAGDRRVAICGEAKNGYVIVSVTDTGDGVSAEAAQGIFSWTDSTKEGGMGLGLSISRTIVDGHGGHIWLDRSDGTGSTFCFSVPRDPADCVSANAGVGGWLA